MATYKTLNSKMQENLLLPCFYLLSFDFIWASYELNTSWLLIFHLFSEDFSWGVENIWWSHVQNILRMKNSMITGPFNCKPFPVNPFHATDLFIYPLKTSENLWFSDVFRGNIKRPVAWYGLSYTQTQIHYCPHSC